MTTPCGCGIILWSSWRDITCQFHVKKKSLSSSLYWRLPQNEDIQPSLRKKSSDIISLGKWLQAKPEMCYVENNSYTFPTIWNASIQWGWSCQNQCWWDLIKHQIESFSSIFHSLKFNRQSFSLRFCTVDPPRAVLVCEASLARGRLAAVVSLGVGKNPMLVGWEFIPPIFSRGSHEATAVYTVVYDV